MPEDTLVLVANTAETKSIWLTNLQRCVSSVLKQEKRQRKQLGNVNEETGDFLLHEASSCTTPPIIRNTTYVFKVSVVTTAQ